ncbi:MAG: hypothetical protein ACRC26_00920, partial [Bacteroidales bacterium]
MRIKKILYIILLCLSVTDISAQDFYEPEYIVNMDSTVFNPSARQLSVARNQTVMPVNPRWSKTVYRFISFKNTAEAEANSFLAEPRTPILYYTNAGEA